MAADGSIIIDTKIDQDGFNTGLDKLKSGAKVGGAAIGAAIGVATVAIGAFAAKGIDLASNLQEVQNVVDVTFGDMNGAINEWAQNAGAQFGLSELAAKQYSSTLGAMMKSAGVTGDALVDMSTGMAGMAGDFASFYNLDTDEAFDKIRSGLSGESEPLKQLGLDLSDTALQQYALTQGITESTSSMTQAEKMTLRYGLLMQQGSDAMGDFASTSDSFANQQRILQMQIENVSASLGSKLLPVASSAMSGIMALITDMGPAFDDTFSSLAELLSGTSEDAGAAAEKLGGGLSGIITTLAGAVIDAAPAVIQAFMGIVNGVMQALPELLTGIVGVLSTAIQAIVTAFPTLIPLLLQAIVSLVTALVAQIPILIPILIQALIDTLSAVIAVIPTLIEQLLGALTSLISALVGMLPTLIPMLVDGSILLFMALVEALPLIIDQLIAAAVSLIDTVSAMLPTLIPVLLDAAVKLFFALVDAAPLILDSLLGAVGDLIDAAISSIGTFVDAMATAGGDLIAGVWQGISDKAQWLKDKISGFFGGVVDSIKDFFGIHSPSDLMDKEIGLNMILGVGKGWKDNASAVISDMVASVNGEMGRFTALTSGTGAAAVSFATGGGGNSTTNNSTASNVFNISIAEGAISDMQSLLASVKQVSNMGTLAEGMY